jgi:WD40 repeat protein
MLNMIAMPLIEVEKKATLTGHRDCIYALEKGERENHFFSASGDGMVVLWNLNDPENGQLIAKVDNSVYALKYLSENNRLLIGQNFAGVHLLDVATKKELRSAAITDSYIFQIVAQGPHFFVGTGDGTLCILMQDDLTTVAKIKLSDQSLRSIAFSEDGLHIALGYSDNSIRILDAQTWELRHQLEGHTNSVFTVVFSKDNRFLLSGSRDAHLRIWDVQNDFAQLPPIVAHMYTINDIVYSPDGEYFATCSMDKSIKVWNARTFRLMKVIDKARHAGHGTSVNKLYWSRYHNQWLLSCSDDRSISAWEIDFKQ